jgi:hypothetical protein
LYQYQNEIDPQSDLYTIEHILPEHANEEWGEFTWEEINRSVYKIGNLTLLEKNLNKDAAQKGYSDKVKIYNTSNSKITQSISEHYITWNEDKISARQRELAKHAKSIWRIQELSN